MPTPLLKTIVLLAAIHHRLILLPAALIHLLTPAAVIQVLTYYHYLLRAPTPTHQVITVAIPLPYNHHHHLITAALLLIIREAVQITADLQMTTVELVAIAVEEEIPEAIILAIAAAEVEMVAETMEVVIMAEAAIPVTNGIPLRCM
jgi:hypothetical protein